MNSDVNSDEEACISSDSSISNSCSDKSEETFKTVVKYAIPKTKIFEGTDIRINIECFAKYGKFSINTEGFFNLSEEQNLQASCSQNLCSTEYRKEKKAIMHLNIILTYKKAENRKMSLYDAEIEETEIEYPEGRPSIFKRVSNGVQYDEKIGLDIEIKCKFYQKMYEEECMSEMRMDAIIEYWEDKHFYDPTSSDDEDGDEHIRSFVQFTVPFELCYTN